MPIFFSFSLERKKIQDIILQEEVNFTDIQKILKHDKISILSGNSSKTCSKAQAEYNT